MGFARPLTQAVDQCQSGRQAAVFCGIGGHIVGLVRFWVLNRYSSSIIFQAPWSPLPCPQWGALGLVPANVGTQSSSGPGNFSQHGYHSPSAQRRCSSRNTSSILVRESRASSANGARSVGRLSRQRVVTAALWCRSSVRECVDGSASRTAHPDTNGPPGDGGS